VKCNSNGFTTAHLGQDLFGGLGPEEGFGIFVIDPDIIVNGID